MEHYDLVKHLKSQIEWSYDTFGPDQRSNGVLDHITKEVEEVRQDPSDIEEWIDIALLALDGAWRAGYSPIDICNALAEKLRKNKTRSWPDWKESDPNKAMEHIEE